MVVGYAGGGRIVPIEDSKRDEVWLLIRTRFAGPGGRAEENYSNLEYYYLADLFQNDKNSKVLYFEEYC